MGKGTARPTRRAVLKGLGSAVGAAALGCTSNDRPSGVAPDAGRGDAGAIPADDAGAACPAEGGLSSAELLSRIETIVVLCMENRSFDHYLGSLALAEGRGDLDGLTGSESNDDPDGHPVLVHPLSDFTPEDPDHGWEAAHAQWNDGANDGFVRSHAGPSQADVMGYHVRAHIPILYALADGAALCDRWFCSVLGPTWPNRFYLHGGSSNGVKDNRPAVGFRSVFDQLAEAGVSRRNYFHDLAWASGGYLKIDDLAPIEAYFEEAEAGALPQFSIIDPQFTGQGANDDHPDHDIQLGQALIASVFAALARSPQWERSLFVLTYDENGGFFDHVPPPPVIDDREEFRRLGFRVPAIVAGPFVRRGCPVHTVLEHSSVAATVARRFGLDPLNQRVAAAADLSVCIDPAALDSPRPPPPLPPIEVSRAALRQRPIAASPHAELEASASRLPPHLDRRRDAAGISERVLAWGHRLGAVHLID